MSLGYVWEKKLKISFQTSTIFQILLILHLLRHAFFKNPLYPHGGCIPGASRSMIALEKSWHNAWGPMPPSTRRRHRSLEMGQRGWWIFTLRFSFGMKRTKSLKTRGKTIQNDQMHQVKRVLAQSVCPFGSLHRLKSRGHREGLDGDAFSSRATMARIEVPVCVGGTGSCHVEVWNKSPGLKCIGWLDLVSA